MRAVSAAVLVALAPSIARAEPPAGIAVVDGTVRDEHGVVHDVGTGVYLSEAGAVKLYKRIGEAEAKNQALAHELKNAAEPPPLDLRVVLIPAALALVLGGVGGFALARAIK